MTGLPAALLVLIGATNHDLYKLHDGVFVHYCKYTHLYVNMKLYVCVSVSVKHKLN